MHFCINLLDRVLSKAFQKLAQKKQNRIYSAPQLGLGVTEMCRSTALPAVAQSPRETADYPVSREVLIKETQYQKANGRLKTYMQQGDEKERQWLATYLDAYQFPYDFDNLGAQ